MNKQNKYKKFLVFIIGKLIFSFGISFGNRSLFGGNPMAVFVVGLSKHLPLSVGTCNLIVAFFEIVIGTILDSKHTTWVSWVAMVVGSYLIDFANLFVPVTDVFVTRTIYMLVGIVFYCFGLALEQIANIGYSNLDVFIYGIKKATKVKKYHTAKWFVDIMFIIGGFLLKAEIGIGTVLIILVAGLLIEFFKSKLTLLIKE